MPKEVWKDQRPLELQPFQTIVVNVPTGTKVPAQKSVAITMACEKQQVSLPVVTVKLKDSEESANGAAPSAKKAAGKTAAGKTAKNAKNAAKQPGKQAANRPSTQPAEKPAAQKPKQSAGQLT